MKKGRGSAQSDKDGGQNDRKLTKMVQPSTIFSTAGLPDPMMSTTRNYTQLQGTSDIERDVL